MNTTIVDRMNSIEKQLKELRKEMEESITRYKDVQDGEKMPYYPFTDYTWPTPYPNGLETKCLWDSIPVEDRMKPMGLSCSCRKCSAYC